MVEKVTDPQKQVTDIILLNHLAKQGIDKDFVEFFQDYAPRSLGKEHSPTAKFYRDLKSNKRFMVVSGLPMVDVDGNKIEVGWRVAGINYFTEKNNLFRAKVQGTQVEVTIRNDQPGGRKAGDKLTFKPQLFLDGVEQLCGQSTLLPVDPLNSNYLENTLEWDYGICKRRLRIIEGRILGSWVFASKPSGEVRIKYNQTGDYRLRLGQFKVSDDEEVVKPEDFDGLALFLNQGYPVTIGDSATFYPDPTTSVDGLVGDEFNSLSWANLRNEAGSAAYDAMVTEPGAYMHAKTVETNVWADLYRGYTLFDESSLPTGAVLSAATASVYGHARQNSLNLSDAKINIYSGVPASNTVLVASDFAIAKFGSTAYCNTGITYNNWKITDPYWNDFVFNATGLAAAQAAADANGVLKLGWREQTYDANGGTPVWLTGNAWFSLTFKQSEYGNGYKPKLVVTYTVVGWANIAKVNSIAVADLAKVNGVAVADIAKFNGVAV